MNNEGLPNADTIAIAGLGLIGGSLARRLVANGRRVVAWNHRPHPYEQARAAGIECVGSIEDLALAKPDVLVLCTPLKAMPQALARLAPVLDPHATLTDVGSVKGQVRDEVRAAGLEDRYVGAHPMAGSEFSGYGASSPELYDDALWAVTVDDDTDYDRFLLVADMICTGVGNRIIVLDDDTHDCAAAMISHMPHVVATALANELTDMPERNIAQALAAGCWRDMTRVALTDPDRTRAMVEEDATNVAELLRHMSGRLADMADLLESESSDARGEAAESARDSIRAFFAVAQPYREFKAWQRSGDIDYDEVSLSIDGGEWQSDLLESAKRGEHIIRLAGRESFVAQVRTAL
ncbi:prephenate dehydrogenase/arogenate dehydrogenase family protein [Bifidobacterium sp. SMB2]|uniref:Prephenate dehydrogenase/arogenate dehydrogenase family protein n=2 Tax=Bifidobacterium TaxID=1678 RepID=A0ABX0C7T3_9BIFI|nr:prephenate dehydrogenase/arogenate dehydrogenase family protein [Bifidobacterium sp. SMB2]NEH11216.1 prephenate dehydrogenase/arogenate dehydrogenase family protein [Bifidobacterium saimiriisciurei]